MRPLTKTPKRPGPAVRNALAAGFFLLAGAIAWVALPPLREALGHFLELLAQTEPGSIVRALRDYLLGFGLWAPVVSAALMILQCVIAPIPGVIVTLANGMLFGWAWGGALSWASAMVGAAICFWIAQALGRPVVERLVGGGRILVVADRFFDRYGHRAVLVSRLLPFISFDVISYGAGLTSMRLLPFLVATGIGQIPATVVYSMLGEGLVDTVPWHFWVACLVLSAGFIIWPLMSARARRVALARGSSNGL